MNLRTCHVVTLLAMTGICTVFLYLLPVEAAPLRPHFTDIAPRSRFSYVSNNSFTGRKYFPQPMCGGIAILDFDGDGQMDIFFTNGAQLPELKRTGPSYYNCLLRNRGDGTFEDVTARAGLTGADLDFSFGVAAGDYDNDGHSDLFLCNAGRNTLYHNNGDGTFTDVTDQSGIGGKPDGTLSVAAAWFDYDNDGLLDLVVSNYTVWSPASDVRCENGGIDRYCSPKLYKPVPQRLYHNLGHGKFEDVTVKAGFGAALGKGMGIGIADFNNDGYLDVFLANDTERNFLYVNQGDGTFKEMGILFGVAYNDDGTTVSAMGCDVKDYDNDGYVDVFYNNLMGQRLSENLSGWSTGFIDYDNDGWKDIYSSNGDVDNIVAKARQHDTIFENVDGKSFRDVSQEMGKDFLRTGFQRGSAFADFNNDGAMDLVVTSLNEKPRILMNSGGTGNHWLLLDATGRQSNRDAIGTRFKLTLGSGRTLYNHLTTSVGFMSTSDRRVHFGLGGEKVIQSLEIRWPKGIVQTLANVPADRILKIEEPAQ
ncbi:MAG: CRTAC1 family protein [Candidatus Solibacter sp.]|nr:CRTAC1 family protein [Candidatus Solibacter sp.]